MAIILKLQNHVMKHFSCPHPTLLLGAVSRGSTVVNFYFPRVELERFGSLAKSSSRFFKELNIIEFITIDNQLCYQNESLALVTLKVTNLHYIASLIILYTLRLEQVGVTSKSVQIMINSLEKKV